MQHIQRIIFPQLGSILGPTLVSRICLSDHVTAALLVSVINPLRVTEQSFKLCHFLLLPQSLLLYSLNSYQVTLDAALRKPFLITQHRPVCVVNQISWNVGLYCLLYVRFVDDIEVELLLYLLLLLHEKLF